jgi:uncharacterized membrane protein
MTENKNLETEPAQPQSSKTGPFRGLRNKFLTGLIVALPLFVTVMGISWIVGGVDTYVIGLIPDSLRINPWFDFVLGIPGLGLIIVMVSLVILGSFATNFIGTSIIRAGERLLARVPVVSNVYNFFKQIVATVAQQSDRSFKEVVLIEYPRPGLWAVAFVTAELQGAPRGVLGEGFVCVFVPTTPNPTSGFLLFVKRDDMTVLDMTPEEGAKMIISGGMVSSNQDVLVTPIETEEKRREKESKSLDDFVNPDASE